MIEELGRWVLRQACAEAATWPAPLSVAVNLSAAQFRQDGEIVGEVKQALADSGLAPQRLEVEITESLLMSNADQALSALQALHAMGVRIAMDDFGTGYSSLAYLWRFPFDKVKIDRAFTQNMQSDARWASSSSPSCRWRIRWTSASTPRVWRQRRRWPCCASMAATSCRGSCWGGRRRRRGWRMCRGWFRWCWRSPCLPGVA